MSNVIMLRETFSTYGLNKYRNFLAKDYLEIFDEDELGEWAAEKIQENGCDHSAVFAIAHDLTMYVAVTNYDEEDNLVIDLIKFSWDMDAFARIDSMYNLCCYALIEEIEPGIWKIMEE